MSRDSNLSRLPYFSPASITPGAASSSLVRSRTVFRTLTSGIFYHGACLFLRGEILKPFILLKTALSNARREYDYILIDCMPTLGMMTLNARDIISSLKSSIGQKIRMFDTEIPQSVRVAESSIAGESIFSYDKSGKVADAYRNLTKEVAALERNKTDRSRDDGVR